MTTETKPFDEPVGDVQILHVDDDPEFADLTVILLEREGERFSVETAASANEAISAGVTDYLQKGSGSEQYALLANRIANAVEQARASRRATEYRRVSTVVREINRALVSATESPDGGARFGITGVEFVDG